MNGRAGGRGGRQKLGYSILLCSAEDQKREKNEQKKTLDERGGLEVWKY